MAVILTDEEFEFLYETFEQLHSVNSDDEQLAEAIRLQFDIWHMLRDVKTRLHMAASDDTPREHVEHRTP